MRTLWQACHRARHKAMWNAPRRIAGRGVSVNGLSRGVVPPRDTRLAAHRVSQRVTIERARFHSQRRLRGHRIMLGIGRLVVLGRVHRLDELQLDRRIRFLPA